MRWKRLLVQAAIVSLGVTAAIAIGILLFGGFGETEWQVLGTTAAITLFSLLALPGAVLLEQRRAGLLAWLSVGLSTLSFALAEILIWSDGGELLAKLFGTATACALASTQIAALTTRLRSSDRDAVRVVFAAAVVLALVLATMGVAAIWGEIDDETYYRVLAALAVLDVFLIVVQPFLRRLGGEAPAAVRIRVTVDPGGEEELELRGRDFGSALGEAVQRLERGGHRVLRIERI